MKNKKLDEIYQLYMKDIYYYIFSLCKDSYLAEDIVQETFYRAYLYLEDCSENKIKPWLFRVAYNTLVDFKRKQKKSLIKDDSYFERINEAKSLEEEFLTHEQIREINEIVATIPENQRQAILLCDFNGLSYKEASVIMNVSLSHLKVLLFRARGKIRIKRRDDNSE